jgi:hypothetical protein
MIVPFLHPFLMEKVVDHTVENPKRIDEKHVEENEGSSQSTSFDDDPPPIQTEVPSPSERDAKMAQSSESTDAHSRNKQENVLKWETPAFCFSFVGVIFTSGAITTCFVSLLLAECF